jgi:hypothetical protein
VVRNVSRGQKTTPEKIYEIIASYAVTHNYKQTSRDTGVPVSTVKKIVDEHIKEPEFEKLCNETKEGFADSATKIIGKGLILLERRFNRAMMQEAELDMFIQEINETNKLQLSQQEKSILITKLRGLQLYDVKAITTAIGTLYDKRALAEGGSTDNVTVRVKLPEGIDEYAG